jgi:hypothetical protein
MRTESAVNFNERQDRLAETNPASTGKIMRKLDEHRDSWKCECQDAAKYIRDKGGMAPKDIPPEWRVPLHRNCMCQDRPIMKDPGEFIDEIFAKYKFDDL